MSKGQDQGGKWSMEGREKSENSTTHLLLKVGLVVGWISSSSLFMFYMLTLFCLTVFQNRYQIAWMPWSYFRSLSCKQESYFQSRWTLDNFISLLLWLQATPDRNASIFLCLYALASTVSMGHRLNWARLSDFNQRGLLRIQWNNRMKADRERLLFLIMAWYIYTKTEIYLL